MADLLASLGIAPKAAAPVSTGRGLPSIEAFREQLRDIVSNNVTPTRATNISETVELRDTVTFVLNLSEADNEALVALSELDPSLGGIRFKPVQAESGENDPTLRSVAASEALTKQPNSDPALQRALAKQIVATISQIDLSAWQIREVSKQHQGWTFTYICKDSMQQWTRDHGKEMEERVIGEYNQKEADPVLQNRPAFDCGGSLTIAFPRNGRSISIGYEHTPIHQTVAQLKELFQPTPRPEAPKKIAEAKKKAEKAAKTPKTPKTPRAPKTPKTPKSAATGENGEKKAKEKRASTAGESSRPRKRKKKEPEEGQVTGEAAADGLPNGGEPAAGSGTADAAGTGAVQVQASGSVPVVSAAEANRRKEMAQKLLSDAGVDPLTLSVEQFKIFANQSPDLQKDSLAMLVKYGAQRLQIVHPSNREGSALSGADSSSPSARSTEQSATGEVTTKELVPHQNRNSLPDTPGPKVSATDQAATKATPNPKPLTGKSRLVCFACKERKVKCSKERPKCIECNENSRHCEYPAPKPRNRTKSARKSDAIIVQSDEEEEEEEEEGPKEDVSQIEVGPHGNWQMPVADMLGPTTEQPHHNPQPEHPDFYQPSPNLVLPQTGGAAGTQTSYSAVSGLAHPQNSSFDNNAAPLRNPASSHQHGNNQAAGLTGHETGRRSRASAQLNDSPVTSSAATVTPPLPYQNPLMQDNSQASHRRSNSYAQREQMQQNLSHQSQTQRQMPSHHLDAQQTQHGRASPSQHVDSARNQARQAQRGRTLTPVNGGSGNSQVSPGQSGNPASHLSLSRDAAGSGGMMKTRARERIPYQPYSAPGSGSTNSHQQNSQDFNNLGTELPAGIPAGNPNAYPSSSTGNQWQQRDVQNNSRQNDRSAYKNAYSHDANSQNTLNSADLRNATQHGGAGNQPQRNYQPYSGQQKPGNNQGNDSQQHNWLENNNGSYNQFGQYWS